MADTSTTLAPCPFCGGDARRSTGGNGAAAWFGSGCDADQSCPAHLRALMHRTQDEADSAWNRRAPAPASSEPVAGCTRSHPHEDMSHECRIKSVIAELDSMAARGAEATGQELGRFADSLRGITAAQKGVGA